MSDISNKVKEKNKVVHNEVSEFHDVNNSYCSRNACKKFYEEKFIEILNENNIDLENKSVLEFGCGTGNFAPFILSYKNNKYTGLDISEGMIEKAKDKRIENSEFICSSAEGFMENKIKKGEKYDIIFSFSFIHHLFDLEYYLKNILNILKGDGIVICLHEPVLYTKKTFFQKVDKSLIDIRFKLNFLLGKNTNIKGFFNRISFIKSKIFNKEKETIDTNVDKKDYVDYQIGSSVFKPENINNKLLEKGVDSYFKKYTYSFYPELFKNFKFNNHFYLVLKGTKK